MIVDNLGRECSNCLEYKLWENFRIRKDRNNYRVPTCKKCENIVSRIWQINNPEKTLRNQIKQNAKRVGLDPEKVYLSFMLHDGYCDICGKRAEETGDSQKLRLCMDHDHENSKLRGWLCNKCNVGISCFYDDPSILRKAAKYLDQILPEQIDEAEGNGTRKGMSGLGG